MLYGKEMVPPSQLPPPFCTTHLGLNIGGAQNVSSVSFGTDEILRKDDAVEILSTAVRMGIKSINSTLASSVGEKDDER